MQRYFMDQSLTVGETVTLPSSVAKHWLQVMRGEAGDQAELVDDTEHLFLGQLTTTQTVTIVKPLTADVELPVNITILSGLPKQDKAEWIVQKATEMGAYRIAFFAADWSIAKWQPNKQAKKIERLQKIARGAAEQSHRLHVPEIAYYATLQQALTQLTSDQLVVAYEEAAKQGESAQLIQVLKRSTPHQAISAVFGPEGGISPAELTLLKDHGATVAGLGPRILRTETAPLYLLAAASTVWELQ